MDAFLPGIGDWTKVWLLRDLWHFHFYGETPLKLVAGRERTYFEHFWMILRPTKRNRCRNADRRIYAKAMRNREPCVAGFEVFKAFEQDARIFPNLKGQARDADACVPARRPAGNLSSIRAAWSPTTLRGSSSRARAIGCSTRRQNRSSRDLSLS